MNEDLNMIHAGITGVIGAFTTLLGFFGYRVVNQVDQNTKDIATHKVDDAGKYATNDQLARVHERIDESIKTSAENTKEVRADIGEIKNLLINNRLK